MTAARCPRCLILFHSEVPLDAALSCCCTATSREVDAALACIGSCCNWQTQRCRAIPAPGPAATGLNADAVAAMLSCAVVYLEWAEGQPAMQSQLGFTAISSDSFE